jgi:hypothetical protein
MNKRESLPISGSTSLLSCRSIGYGRQEGFRRRPSETGWSAPGYPTAPHFAWFVVRRPLETRVNNDTANPLCGFQRKRLYLTVV